MWDDLGEALGRLIAWAVGLFGFIWNGIGAAVGSFFGGVARGLGLKDPGLFSWLMIGVGLLLVLGAVQGLMRRSFVGAAISLFIGLTLIAWVIA